MGDMRNHFTGYLLSAIKKEQINYIRKNSKWMEHEVLADTVEKSGKESFEDRLLDRLENQRKKNIGEWKGTMQNDDLVVRLNWLKEREQDIIFRRIFLNQSFEQIGKEYQITEKQTQQAYHYAIRKMRG